MKTRYALAVMVAIVALAVFAPATAESVKGVVKSLDPEGEIFVVVPEDSADDPMTFTVPDGKNFDEFVEDIEVGDDVRVDYDPDFCGDNPACTDVATDIEEL